MSIIDTEQQISQYALDFLADTLPITFHKMKFIRNKENSNFKYYIVCFDNKSIFDINGNPTALHNPIYISEDGSKWIMGSEYGNHERGISYVKEMNGVSDVVETDIYRQICEQISRDEFISLIKILLIKQLSTNIR
jgi:hypothetical protein